MGFNLRHLLRHIPSRTLRPFLESVGFPCCGGEMWDRDEVRLARTLCEAICALPVERRDTIIATAQRIHSMGCERGRNAILNAAANRHEIAIVFDSLGNDHERVAWAFISDRDLFQAAEELHYFDHHAEGQLGRSFHGPKGAVVSRDPGDLDTFEEELQGFFRQRDGSGRSCTAEVIDRYADGSVQATIYVEALPSESPEFVDGEIKRRRACPVIEAAVVYCPANGTTTTVTRGGRDVHEALRNAFAEHLLRVQPDFDPIQPRRFRLQELLSPKDLPTDPRHGIEQVRVRRLKLIPSDRSLGALVIEAPAGQPSVSFYRLAQQWFVRGIMSWQGSLWIKPPSAFISGFPKADAVPRPSMCSSRCRTRPTSKTCAMQIERWLSITWRYGL